MRVYNVLAYFYADYFDAGTPAQKVVLRRICSRWKLDVVATDLTPSSIASKPSACLSRQRVRSKPKRQKPPFAHRKYFFFAEACRLGSVKLFFTVPCSRRDRFKFSFFCLHFALPFPFRTDRTPRQLVPFPSIHAAPLCFSNSPTVRRTPYSMRTPVFRASLRNKSPSSQSVALCLFFVTWTQRCVCGPSIGGSLFLICSWLL